MNESNHNTIQDLVGIISEVKSDFIQIVPNLVGSLAILFVGILVAYLLRWISSLLIRWGVKILPSQISNKPSLRDNIDSVARGTGSIIFFITLFLVITTALKRLGLEIVSSWFQNLAKYLPNVVVASIILFLGWKLKDFLAVAINRTLSRTEFSHSRLASAVLSWAVFVISALVALEQVGIDMGLVVTVSTVLAGVISGGIALMFALGAKSTISDIICCFQIQRYMKVGQKVEIAGFKGTVESIGPTFVVLETEKGRVTIPGSQFRQGTTLILSGEG